MVGQVGLLPRRFAEGVLVPQAVWQEVVETGKGQPGSEEVASASWVVVREVRDEALVSLLRGELDAGEAEAIALAREEQVPLVLLDEKDARRVARRMNLRVLGTGVFWYGPNGLVRLRAFGNNWTLCGC
jgi:hypothetical protein